MSRGLSCADSDRFFCWAADCCPDLSVSGFMQNFRYERS